MNEDSDDMAMAEPLAGEELERMLARYARVRLDPSHAQARRARSAVMEEAWRRRIDATRSEAGRTARRLPFAGWGLRRVGVSLPAAVFAGLLVGTSVFAGSRAGGPLYEPRLALEELGLPTDPSARVDAQLHAAQMRLGEAVEASGRHDDGATLAALAAYDRMLAELEAATGPAADRALVAIQFHHTVLEQIAETAPLAAAGGLERALANNERLMLRLTAAGTGPGTGAPGGGSGAGPMGNPGSGPRTAPGGGRPTQDPKVDATPKPGRPTDAPDSTPRPTKEPRPTPTPQPTETPEPSATDPDPTQHPRPTPRPRPSNPGGPPDDDGGRGEERAPAPGGARS